VEVVFICLTPSFSSDNLTMAITVAMKRFPSFNCACPGYNYSSVAVANV